MVRGGLQDQNAWAELEDAEAAADSVSRRVLLGPGAAAARFPGNAITTSKYNIVTFVPIFLFVMFSRVAYLYFLLQVRTFLPYSATSPCQRHVWRVKPGTCIRATKPVDSC